THTYWMLLASRIIAGVGGSSIGVAQAYIADVTTKEERSKGMGLIGAAFGLGFVFGPLIGGFLAKYGYNVTGFTSAGFSTLAFLSTLLFLPESHRSINKQLKIGKKLFDIESIKKIFKKPDLAIVIILFFLLTFSIANIYGTFALLGYKVYGFTDLQNGYIFGIVGLVGAIVQGGLIRVFAKYISDIKLVTIGAFCMMIGLGLMPYGGNFLGLSIITIVLALGTGILQPTLLSLASKITTEEEQGVTLGINQSFSSFARVLGPLWGGFAFEFLGYPFPFLTGAAFTFLILIISLTYLPKKILMEKNAV
ncbi:MAG: MFS transporter, partial [Ignavibacteriaceae bacterium]